MYESGPFGEASGRPVAGGRRDLQRAQAAADLRARSRPASGELRGRVNLLNWDGNGAPPGSSPAHRDGATRRDRAAPSSAADHATTASCTWSPGCCLDYPDAGARSTGLPLLREPWPSRRLAGAATELRRPARPPRRRRRSTGLQRDYVDTFDLSRKHALYLSYWTDGDTRRRGEVLGRFKTAYRAQRLPRRHPRRAARLPPDGAGVRGAASTRRRARAAAGVPAPAWSCCGSRWQEKQSPYAGVRRRPCARRFPGTSPPTARPSWRWSADRAHPTEAVGLDPYDPRLLPLQPVRRRDRRAVDERPALGRAALRLRRDPRRRHHLALPLRQVRLDHPLVAALRVAAAAHRLAALPLRHPARLRRPRRRPGHPRVVDRGGRRQRGALPLQRAAVRRHRRGLHARRHPHPRLPPAHDRAGLHGDDEERQADVRRCSSRPSCSACWTTLVSVGAGQRGAQLPRDRVAVVPVGLPAAARRRRDGRGAVSSSTSTPSSACCCSRCGRSRGWCTPSPRRCTTSSAPTSSTAAATADRRHRASRPGRRGAGHRSAPATGDR